MCPYRQGICKFALKPSPKCPMKTSRGSADLESSFDPRKETSQKDCMGWSVISLILLRKISFVSIVSYTFIQMLTRYGSAETRMYHLTTLFLNIYIIFMCIFVFSRCFYLDRRTIQINVIKSPFLITGACITYIDLHLFQLAPS